MSVTIIQELYHLLRRQQLSGRSTVWLSDANRQAFFRPPARATDHPAHVPAVAPPAAPTPTAPSAPPAGKRLSASPPAPPKAPPKAIFAGFDWPALSASMSDCQRCALSSSRSHLQFGLGQQRARVMFIADYPTKEEDAANDIRSSETGKLLFSMIRAMRLDPDSNDPQHAAYVTHVLKCRLSDARRYPTQSEVHACLPCLWRQIELCRPQAIVLFGMLPLRALLDPAYTNRHRHQWHEYQGIPVMPTLHPNEILRMQNQPQAFVQEKKKAWHDLQQVMAKLNL